MTDWIIQGDEAWTPDEWADELARRQRRAASRRRWEARPDVRERRRAYFREYSRRRRAGRQYTHLTLSQIDEQIARFQDRIARLRAEKQRRLERAA